MSDQISQSTEPAVVTSSQNSSGESIIPVTSFGKDESVSSVDTDGNIHTVQDIKPSATVVSQPTEVVKPSASVVLEPTQFVKPEEVTVVSKPTEVSSVDTEKVSKDDIITPSVTTVEAKKPEAEEKLETTNTESSGFAKKISAKSPAEHKLCELIDKYITIVKNDSGKESDKRSKVITMKDILLFPSNANVPNNFPLYDILSKFVEEYRNTLVLESRALQNLHYINNRQEIVRFTTVYTIIKEIIDCKLQNKKFMLDVSKIKRDLGSGPSGFKFESFIAWVSMKEERLNKKNS